MFGRRWAGSVALVASGAFGVLALQGLWVGVHPVTPSTPTPLASPPVADASAPHSFMFKVGHGIGQVEPGMYEVDALSTDTWCSWSVYDGTGEMFGGVIPTTGGVVVPDDAKILLLQGCGDLREPAGMFEQIGPREPSEEVV